MEIVQTKLMKEYMYEWEKFNEKSLPKKMISILT